MIIIIHGEDTASSRNHYLEEKQKAKNPIVFEGAKLMLSDLMQSLEGGSLFNEEKEIFIENLLSDKKLNPNLKEIIGFIEKQRRANIYLWEKTELSKTDASLLKGANLRLFKISQNMFSFLDNIKPNSKENIKNFHLLLKNSPEELIFFMIVRQFRLLLAVSSNFQNSIDEVKRLAPWQKAKLKAQSSLFGVDKLKEIYAKLSRIDYEQKTGKSSLTFLQAIDFFLAGL